jgi:hypothetical protein
MRLTGDTPRLLRPLNAISLRGNVPARSVHNETPPFAACRSADASLHAPRPKRAGDRCPDSVFPAGHIAPSTPTPRTPVFQAACSSARIMIGERQHADLPIGSGQYTHGTPKLQVFQCASIRSPPPCLHFRRLSRKLHHTPAEASSLIKTAIGCRPSNRSPAAVLPAPRRDVFPSGRCSAGGRAGGGTGH